MGDGRFPPSFVDLARQLLPVCMIAVGLILLAFAAAGATVLTIAVARRRRGRRVKVADVQLVHYALDGPDLVLDFLAPSRRRRHRNPFGSPVFAVRTPVGTWVDLDVFVRLDYWVRYASPLGLRLRRPGRRPVQHLRLSDGVEQLSITARWAAPVVGQPAVPA